MTSAEIPGDEWHRAVLDAAIDGVVVIDAQGTVRAFNPGAERIFGHAAGHVIGENVSMLMPHIHRDAHDSYLREHHRTGLGHVVGSRRDLLARHADGSELAISLSVGATTIDGEPMFVGVVVDRSGRDESGHGVGAFFELALELLAVATIDGRFLRVNSAWESVLGFPADELVSRSFFDLVHPDDLEATMTVVESLAGGVAVRGFENRCRALDGRYKWLEWSARPLPGRGLMMAAARDVTARKAASRQLRAARDEAERASGAKSEFLSRMSHELRTPLNSVLGFAQLLAMEDLTEQQQDHLGYIQRSGQHLLELINEVLDIAQIEAGHLRFSLEPVGVLGELQNALELIRPMAATAEVQLPPWRDIADEPFVLADRQRLFQVLLNLLSNAVKYNRPGGCVEVDCEASGGTVTVAVRDSGIGIDPSRLGALFSPFERLGAERSGVEGRGVGLALSRALSQEMGGSLTVTSTVGVGSTFFLELPEAATVDGDTGPSGAATRAGGARELKVLYIEDNVVNSRLMERALASRGIDLVSAVQGRLGIDLAAQLQPDLILLDLHLPDMPGEEVLRSLRAIPGLASTAIVVCSADASASSARRLADEGAYAYLPKPLDLGELHQVVDAIRARVVPAPTAGS